VVVIGARGADEREAPESPSITDESLLAKLNEGLSPRTILDEIGLNGKERRELYSRLLALAEQLAD